MKRIFFKFSFLMLFFFFIFLATNFEAYAINVATEMGFDIDEKMDVIMESEQYSYDVKYNKNYWTAHNKGVYTCAYFYSWQGAYKYYDESKDCLYIFLASRCITNPLDQKISIAPSARVKNKAIYQKIAVEQGNLNNKIPTLMLNYSPMNINGTWSESFGVTMDSEGNLVPSYSVTIDHSDIEWIVNCDKDVFEANYNYTRYSSSTSGVYIGTNIHMSSYYFSIKNAKKYKGNVLNFIWDYRADYYIDDAGWENYNASSSDKNNNLNMKKTYNYVIKL